jgi:CHASE2 domain-containing sensor protein
VADREAATPASDIYSFGVLGYEMLVGKRPFKGSFMALLRAHVFDEPPTPSSVNPELSSDLDQAILAPLAKEPASRPASAGEVVTRLRVAWDRLRAARWRAREFPRRLAISAAVAAGTALLVGVAGLLGPVKDLENRLVDSRFRHSASRAPSPQLAIAILDDASLDARPDLTLIEYNEEFARILEPAFEAGVVGVGLDFLAPRKWRESALFERFVLEHSDRLVFGIHSDPDDGKLVGADVVAGFITVVLGEEGAARLLGWTNFPLDRDGAVRRIPPGWVHELGHWHPTLSARIASIILGSEIPEVGREQAFWVDYRIDWRQIPRWPWSELHLVIEQEPEALAGRFLIVGSDIEGFADSSFPLPHPAGMPAHAPGVVVQALMASTLLDGCPIRGPVRWLPPLVAVLMFPFVMLTLWSERAVPTVMAWLGLVVGFAAAGYLLFLLQGLMVELAPALVIFPLAVATAVAIRWKLPSRPVRSATGRTR